MGTLWLPNGGPKGPHLVAKGSPLDTLKISWRSDLIWLRYIGSKMFICLIVYRFVCFFVLIFVGHQQKVPLKILWRFNLIWLRYLGSKNVYLFACLFVCLFICFFNHSKTPTESSPENFVKISLDLAEILRIRELVWKMFIGLFVCLFV